MCVLNIIKNAFFYVREFFDLYFPDTTSSALRKQKSWIKGKQNANNTEGGSCPVNKVEDRYKVNKCPFRHGSVSPDPYPGNCMNRGSFWRSFSSI